MNRRHQVEPIDFRTVKEKKINFLEIILIRVVNAVSNAFIPVFAAGRRSGRTVPGDRVGNQYAIFPPAGTTIRGDDARGRPTTPDDARGRYSYFIFLSLLYPTCYYVMNAVTAFVTGQ